jgi:integrase
VPKTLFTDVAVRNLKPPETGQETHWDTSPGFNGFGLRLSQGGTKTWILMAGPPEKRRRFVLGRYPATSLSDARSAARKLHAELTLGQRTTTTIVFSEAVENYLRTYCLKMRPRHREETERILRRHFLPSLASRHLDQIATRHITAILDPLTAATPSMANNAYACIRTLLRWCVRRSYIRSSPCEPLQRPAPLVSRERVLTPRELAAIYNAAQDMPQPFGYICLLLIHLPLRKNEAALMRWTDITDDLITIPADNRKNKVELVLPNLLVDNLKLIPRTSEYLFPSSAGTPFTAWSKNKRRLDELSGVIDPPWVLHDFRRTFASMAAENELADALTVERILGHVSGTLSPIARVYNRHTYLPQMRQALRQWEKHLAALISSN